MPTLLNNAVGLTGTSGTSTFFITLNGAQPNLGQTPTTSTGYTLVTGSNGQLQFTNTLGGVAFTSSTIQTSVPNGNLTIQSTGTGALNLNGNVYINGQTLNAGTGTFSSLTVTNLTAQVGYINGITATTIITNYLQVNTETVFKNLSVTGGVTLSPNNGQDVTIEPTNNGTVYIYPGRTGYLDNLIIGSNSSASGFFTNVTANTLSLSSPLNVTTATFVNLTVTNTATINNLFANTVSTDQIYLNSNNVSLGNGAAADGQQQNGAIAIGYNAGASTQTIYAIAIGYNAGQTGQQGAGVAIGFNSGVILQGNSAIAIGQEAGEYNQGGSAVAIGTDAGQTNQGGGAIAIGNGAGGTTQTLYATAIGVGAGSLKQGQGAVALGFGSGQNYQGNYAIAIGYNAGTNSQAGVAIGYNAATNNQASSGVAIGANAASNSQGLYSNAIGYAAGQSQGQGSVAVGSFAGQNTQSNYAIAIGYQAGQTNQGANSIAIGRVAGQTTQSNNSIVLNASGVALNAGNASAFYVAPIRTDASSSATSWSVYYNPVTKELTTAASFVAAIISGTDISISTTGTGTLVISDTSTLQSVTNRGATTTNVVYITNTATSTSTNTGALQVAGGVGIGNGLYAGGKILLSPGNNSVPAWTTNGVAFVQTAGTFTDTTTTASSTVAVSYMNLFSAQTYAASTSITVSSLYGTYFQNPVRGTNVGGVTTYALAADSITVISALTVGASLITVGSGSSIGIFSSTGNAGIGTGATTAGNIKTVNIGTGGLTSSTTVVNIGNITTGSTSTIALNGQVILNPVKTSAPAWTTNGISLIQNTATYTDLTSTGTVAAVYINNIGAATVSATNTITITSLYGTYFSNPIGGNNVTATTLYALGADSIRANTLTVASSGQFTLGFSLSSLISTSGSASLGIQTQATSGATIIGSPTGTGAITIGQSTATQTVNIANGANAIGTTKTVNIATGGSTGSNTIVNIGSNASISTVAILSIVSATSTSTGALTIQGGVGIGGNLYVGGTFYAGGQAVLTTSSFASSVNGGTDIQIVTSSSGALIFNDTSTLQTVTSRGSITNNAVQITNNTVSTSTNSGALTISGGVGIGGNVHIGGAMSITNTLTIVGPLIVDSSAEIVNSPYIFVDGSAVAVDSFPTSAYRAVNYFVSVNNVGNNQYQATNILLIQDGVSASIEQTSVFSNGSNVVTFTATVISNVVILYATGANSGNSIKLRATYMTA